MKKLLLLLLILPSLAFGAMDTFEGSAVTTSTTIEGSSGIDTVDGGTVTGGVACSDPEGDQVTEGFETPGYELTSPCGASPCWDETGSPTANYTLSSLSGGSGADENCDYGLQAVGTGADTHTTVTIGSGLSEFWIKFSYYLDSFSFTSGTTITIYNSGIASIRLYNDGGTPQLYARAAGDGSKYTIALDTWYYIEFHVVNNDTGDITIGTSYGGTEIANAGTFTGYDNGAQTTFSIGNLSIKTATMVFGYFTLDDDSF